MKLWHTAGNAEDPILVQFKAKSDIQCIEIEPDEQLGGVDSSPSALDISVGSWCVVRYDGKFYPGEVIQVCMKFRYYLYFRKSFSK